MKSEGDKKKKKFKESSSSQSETHNYPEIISRKRKKEKMVKHADFFHARWPESVSRIVAPSPKEKTSRGTQESRRILENPWESQYFLGLLYIYIYFFSSPSVHTRIWSFGEQEVYIYTSTVFKKGKMEEGKAGEGDRTAASGWLHRQHRCARDWLSPAQKPDLFFFSFLFLPFNFFSFWLAIEKG